MRTPFSRPFLILCGVLYLCFGVAVLLTPEITGGPSKATAYAGLLHDLAGSHGGLNLAAGLFLLYAAFSGAGHAAGLWLVALMNCGYLAGRLITVLEGTPASATVAAAMALEAVLLATALYLALGGPGGSHDRGKHGRPSGESHPRPLV